MWLKDANAFNIQFLDGRPVLIDTLSFEKYMEGAPWIGYRQFCESFFAPLCLISYVHEFHQKTLVAFPDGILLSYASHPCRGALSLLPVFMHIHLQRRCPHTQPQRARPNPANRSANPGCSAHRQPGIGDKKSKMDGPEGRWAGYYSTCSYSKTALSKKRKSSGALEEARPNSVATWARIPVNLVSWLPLAVGPSPLIPNLHALNSSTNRLRRERITNLWPIQCDLIAPSPSIGWDNEERPRILERCRSDMVMALADPPSIACKNVPLAKVASLLQISSLAIVEFVPKSDPQSVEMLRERADAS
jgi:hypothetical protein